MNELINNFRASLGQYLGGQIDVRTLEAALIAGVTEEPDVAPTYSGPWMVVAPQFIPAILLRVPVVYYRAPPPHWHAWRPAAPPRWEVVYGPAWAHVRPAWRAPVVAHRH